MEHRLILKPVAVFRSATAPLLSLVLLLLFVSTGAAAQSRIQLDADTISFEEGSGVATAEGNVRVTDEDIRLFAPYVEYDSSTQQVRARSSQEGNVTFVAPGTRLSGEQLDYNIETRHGILRYPSGRMEEFYVRGDSIQVMPSSELGVRRRLKSKQLEEGEEELGAKWIAATITTCSDFNPHYRMETKEIIVIPNEQIIVKRPKVYFEKHLLFTYPFDYVVPLGYAARRRKQMIFPRFGYESGKGAGFGFSGPFTWDGGSLYLDVIGWTKGIWEGEALFQQEIGRGWNVYGGVKHEYDKDREETEWRPRWGLEYETDSGWRFHAGWTQRELVTIEKRAGSDSRYTVWRKPEINIVSPWYNDAATAGHFRLFGTWGKYEDTTYGPGPTIERYGAGAQLYGDFGERRVNFQPFYNTFYWYYHYDDAINDRQQILEGVLGVRWRAGDFNMETAYLRRWTWGESPMYWDNFDTREDIYQQIGYRIKTKKKDYWWDLAVRAAYSLEDEELAEMAYKAAYNQHCMRWELIYRDDRRGGDDWIGLNLTINAYPDNTVRLSGSELFDPAKAPDSLAGGID